MSGELDALWAHHHAEWRDPLQIVAGWESANELDRKLLRHQAEGDFWDVLQSTGMTLLLTREYEHLVLALDTSGDAPRVSYLKIPHPSGIAFDAQKEVLYLAATRNPNQILELKSVQQTVQRRDMAYDDALEPLLMPLRSNFYPGCLYIHDLAMIDGELYANSVGQNAVVKFTDTGVYEIAWYPNCIIQDGEPVLELNYLQLNSIAAGSNLEDSYFSASTDEISARRPGHQNFPVDKRGVIFSGKTREVFARGLTRPHSARLHDGRVWVDNSGYGEVGFAENGGFEIIARLPGWTRGLAFHGEIAFVATSRVIPRPSQYAPGLDVKKSRCGVHAVNVQSGEILGSLFWAYGNQIFSVELVPAQFTVGFPFLANAKRATARERKLFYTYQTTKK